jgi:hypothetical protein
MIDHAPRKDMIRNPQSQTPMPLAALDLPACTAPIRQIGGKEMIFDVVRQKYVRLTPEEWVRQHVVQFLLEAQGVPRGLLAVEVAFPYNRMLRRADLLVYDRQGTPLLLVECKAPEVALTQAVFDQAARYNTVVRAAWLLVTNGRAQHVCAIDHAGHTYRFVEALPPFEALQAPPK